jgi:hypothetical protein
MNHHAHSVSPLNATTAEDSDIIGCSSEFLKDRLVLVFSFSFYSSGACQCATFIWFRKNAENGFFQNIFLSINFLNTSYISSCREQNSLQEYVYNMS